MVILIVSAMVGTTKIAQPYLNDLASANGVENYRSLAEYLLLGAGEPSNWGIRKVAIPTVFGLASENQRPFELDLDKVCRLNSDNIHSITYQEILATLGTRDISLNIQIHPIFEVSINLTSSQSSEAETLYTFQIVTSKDGFPISAWLQCYTVAETYISNISSSTLSSGLGFVNTTLPNSLNGTAIFSVFAKVKANSQIIAFNAYLFGHNSENPESNKTFLNLTPLNNVLNVSFQYPTVEVSNAYVFTYNYRFNLSQTVVGNLTEEYTIPNLLEVSPIMLVLCGNNASTSFAEWTTYPQLPLEIGTNFADLTVRSETLALTYIVSVSSVLYEAVIKCRSVHADA